MKNIISLDNMRKSDLFTIENYIDSKELMYKAALGVFNNVDWEGKVGIVAGKGNNAGDGYALSLMLNEHGIKSKILLIEESFSEDGKYFYDLARLSNINCEVINENTVFDFDIIVDCIFGTGFKGKPEGKYADAINLINNSGKYVVSVDINSGLNGDSGLCDVAVISDLTISIGQYKYGHFINMAKDYIKKIINVDIGINPLYKEAYLIDEQDIKDYYQDRKHLSNKGDYGYVGIIGGSSKYPGAIRLASLGQNCLYVGAGVSRLIVPSSIAHLVSQNVLETTIFPMPCIDNDMCFDKEKISEAIKGLKAIGVGVGWGINKENEKILEYLIKNYCGVLIIDADGLNILSRMNKDIINSSKANIVLTPHLKEFSRLCGNTIQEIKENTIQVVRNFVKQYNVTLLLKGPTTIVASKNEMYLIDKGCPGMSTAGSGDVLTGILTGIMGVRQDRIEYGISVGAYINGVSGERASSMFGEVGMVSSDTARCVSMVIKELVGK